MSGSSTSLRSRSSLTSASRRSSGSRTAIADSASRPGLGRRRQVRGRAAGSGRGSRPRRRRSSGSGARRSGHRPRSACRTRRAAATPSTSSAKEATRTCLTSWPTRGSRAARAGGAARPRPRWPSAATTRPSAPATARASGVPRRGRVVVREKRHSDGRLRRQPGFEVAILRCRGPRSGRDRGWPPRAPRADRPESPSGPNLPRSAMPHLPRPGPGGRRRH